MLYGASFSHRHLKYLGLDPQKALIEFKSLNLKWIRLSLYWDEIETVEGKLNFQEIENLVKFCEKNKIDVVLTVGMKAQRYPEYYLPSWVIPEVKTNLTRKINLKNNDELLKHTLNFIEKSVIYLKRYNCIKVWQIENEPLDPAGPNWFRIDKSFLEMEVKLLRQLDKTRKILINIWGNELSIRKMYKTAIDLSNIVGIDIYLKHPIPFLKWLTKYIGPLDSIEKIRQIGKEIKIKNNEFWIMELQSEPWENNELITQLDNPKSFLIDDFKKNLNYAKSLNPTVIFFWGFEYWYWRKEKFNDLRYWQEARNLLSETLRLSPRRLRP